MKGVIPVKDRKRCSPGFALFIAAMLMLLALGVGMMIHGIAYRPPAPSLPGLILTWDGTPYV